MTDLTDPQLRAIAICDAGAYQDPHTARWELSDEELMKFARAVISASRQEVFDPQVGPEAWGE